MKSRHALILLVILMIIVAIVLVFVLPGITRNNDHLKANQFFTEGLACELSKDYACAIDRYQKAIALYGQDSNYFIYLAHVQMSQGDYAESIENYQKAKAIDPSNESILPGINKVISLQATQTALYNPLAMEYTPTTISNSLQEFPTVTSNAEKIPVQPGSLPQAVYTIFDEEFELPKSIVSVSESEMDHIWYEITNTESYSGKKSLLVTYDKYFHHWASLILGFDKENILSKSKAGQMASINLSPPSNYAVQFWAKREKPFLYLPGSTLMDDSVTFKFQDQNILIDKSVGNQAVYVYELEPGEGFIPDGRIPIPMEGWQEFCLPLARFQTDWWINNDMYASFSEADRQFDWSNVKQINIDANFFSTMGEVYIDALRIIHAADCQPYPN